ncbi:MAG: DAK2 domain-containing protein [Chloroflexota bacterium]
MIEGAWDGHELLAALRHARAVLHAHVDEVNALNVFPVPDGDTGSNMLATVQAAIDEADGVPVAERSVSRVAAALSLGALMGARGNSGVILSQLFRGLGEAVDATTSIGGAEMAEALRQGCKAAFAAVAKPVEGTILTVARDVAEAAGRAADNHARLEGVLEAAASAASASVERTPQLLAILRQAGVVDAGGKGLELLLIGALASVRGEALPEASLVPQDIALPSLDALEEEGFGYETVFVVTPVDGAKLDVTQMRRRLDQLGQSVLVAGDHRAAKIHIHNERPDRVIAYGLSLGTLSRINVENLDRQATQLRDRVAAADAALTNGDRVAAVVGDEETETTGLRVVAVAPGEGLARVFTTLGARVVRGGQGANPSAGELAEAIRGLGATEVIILPNNPNVRLAAKQAGGLSKNIKVEVIATRNAAEGIAAMLALDPDASIKDNAKGMSEAAQQIQTMQVTAAVRDARMGRHRVRKGEYIALGPTEGLLASDRDRTAAVLSALRRFKPGYELMTVYRGEGVSRAAADRLRDALKAELDDVEIELVDGGQPHYDFLISAE